MAIDTRPKLESSIQVFGPWTGRIPGPTDTVDKQWVVWMYTGITAATPPAAVSIGELVLKVESTKTLVMNVQSTQEMILNTGSTKELIMSVGHLQEIVLNVESTKELILNVES